MDGIISNIDIEYLCKKFKIKLNSCLSKDNLKYSNIENGGYIINLENSGLGGSHWVGLYIYNNYACYYDSYGAVYPNEIMKFCSRKNIIYNTNQIQHLSDTHCGWYSIAFLYFLQSNNNLNNNLYDEMNKFNDMFLDDINKSSLCKLQNYYKKYIL